VNDKTEPDAARQLSEIDRMLPGEPAAAKAALREFLKSDPLNPEAYRLLAAAHDELRRNAGGVVRANRSAQGQARLMEAARALQADDLPTAEIYLRARLLDEPTDVDALRMLAHFATRLGMARYSIGLLKYAIELAPDFVAAKLDLAKALHEQNRNDDALALIDEVLAQAPSNQSYLYTKAIVLGHAGRFAETIAIYERLLRESPGSAKLWASYGRSLKTVGKSKEGIAAFRRAIEIDPTLGEAWWSLSDLKTMKFEETDVATMEGILMRRLLSDKDRYYLHFALGKAYEDQQAFGPSFSHYAEGNRIRREGLDHDPSRLSSHIAGAIRTFTKQFFEDRRGWGSASDEPIFILGMSRAGSTLVEQILSSHSKIEGTMELPNLPGIAHDLSENFEGQRDAMDALGPQQCIELGDRYIRETRIYRKTNRPFFIDKLPNNWLYVPLIQLILPKARIIDARRHPMACCFSNFKQNYAVGQTFSYDLTDLGNYYSSYVRMMAHIDEVLPGKVHRVFHEDMVDDPEREIRRLLDYLQLPFEEGCLRFHETKRAVRTASAEQVRRPINRHGVDQWRHYEAWLGPLKQALGPVLDSYPDVPDFPN
jgi:tetratricopeptide (TPR) repeat protein